VHLLPVPLRRAGYRVAHALLRRWWRIRRPATRGVKCIVRHGDDVAYVRHTYGDRRRWELPGGGARRREQLIDAVVREAREELGITGARWQEIGSITAFAFGRTSQITCFVATVSDRAVRTDAGEIAELRWAPISRPPQPSGHELAAMLALLDNDR
jgi:8-oxo-dGTP pyrophosphatase MutT (NUDIX family)